MTCALDYYINFVLLAVTGRTGEADTLMVRYGDAIQHIAEKMRRHDRMLGESGCFVGYRGLLLEPGQAVNDRLDHQEDRTFLSWSENLDCALWFASPESTVSEPLKELHPAAEGYLAILHHADFDLVLWHYSWARPLELAIGQSLITCAKLHPQVDHSQFHWNLCTQEEIITMPMGKIAVTPIADMNRPPIAALEKIYCWPGARQGEHHGS